jgi:hypothetical protein
VFRKTRSFNIDLRWLSIARPVLSVFLKMSVTMHGFTKTTPQIYRDCLRLVKHIAGKSKKSEAVTKIVRNEFKKNAAVKDEVVIEKLKSNAIRGLSNYLMMESSAKDERFQKQSQAYVKREVESIKLNAKS